MTKARPKVNSNSGTCPNLCTRRSPKRSTSAPTTPDENRCDKEGRPEPDAPGDLETEIGAEHVEAGMGEIEHAHHAENQRQPARQHEQNHAVEHAVQRRKDDDLEHGPPSSAMRAGRANPSRRPSNQEGRSILQVVGSSVSFALTMPCVLPAPAGFFFIEFRAGIKRAEAGDIHVLEELVVIFAHVAFAAVKGREFHAFELRRDSLRLVGIGFFNRLHQHAHFVYNARIPDRQAEFAAEFVFQLLCFRRRRVGNAFDNREHAMREIRFV